jgi:hypothetical protein
MRYISSTRDSRAVIELGDEWVKLMEMEMFSEAYDFTDHDNNGWSPETIEQVIKAYENQLPTQRVTLIGCSTDISQRKSVTWRKENDNGCVAQLWYDLHIDGIISDLTATFNVMERDGKMWLRLNDIHVM